jgi:hypothetical protein
MEKYRVLRVFVKTKLATLLRQKFALSKCEMLIKEDTKKLETPKFNIII